MSSLRERIARVDDAELKISVIAEKIKTALEIVEGYEAEVADLRLSIEEDVRIMEVIEGISQSGITESIEPVEYDEILGDEPLYGHDDIPVFGMSDDVEIIDNEKVRRGRVPDDMVVGYLFETNNYGMLQVIEYVKSEKVLVRFIETGYQRYTTASGIRRGSVQDRLYPSVYGIGFLGDGRHMSQVRGRKSHKCSMWETMMERCYSTAMQNRCPHQTGWTVCEDWHNFQNFAEWAENEVDSGGFLSLSNSALSSGIKVYSPDTCILSASLHKRPKDKVMAERAKAHAINMGAEG